MVEPDILGALERSALRIGERYRLSSDAAQPIPAWAYIDQATKWLTQAREACTDAPGEARKAAEWVLDNDYQVYRAIRQIKKDLPTSYYIRLPAMGEASGPAYPRAFVLAHELLQATRLQVTLDATVEFISAYQRKNSLTIAELWAFPTMLRIACLEILVSSLDPILGGGLSQPFELTDDANAPYALDDTERVARAIANLSLIAAISWADFFDRTSVVEAVLTTDPSGHYARMDFETRDQYRRAVERLARLAKLNETEVAEAAIAKAADGDPARGQDHVGYWLIGAGQKLMQQRFDLRLAPSLRIRQELIDRAGLVYGLVMFLTWIGALAVPIIYLLLIRAELWEGAIAILVLLLPASILSISVVQRLVTLVVPPRILPKLKLVAGLPADCATVITMPVLVGKTKEIEQLVQQMEMHWLSNKDDNLHIALLADLVDAPSKKLPDDKEITEQLLARTRALNEKHGSAEQKPFHLLMRNREYNPAEDLWMAWERKRGKLEQFNRLLVEGDESGFSFHEGDKLALREIRYVVTVDADTILPTGIVARLVGTIAHPLNQARFDPDSGEMTGGYAILQPRVEMAPLHVSKTLFTRFFAGDTAIDIYSRAVSNVYQDMFGSGIFVGKGIYDVAAFHRCIDGKVAENSILSHDLLEGALGRVGLASDIILYEGFPGTYLEYGKRWHRWVRGDWQLLPWLARHVRTGDGSRFRNTLTTLDRWQIIDNLRRSLVQPSLLVMVVVGWLFLPGNPWFWTLLTIFAHGGQLFTELVTGLAQGRRRGAVRGLFAQLVDLSGRWFLAIVYLPYESVVAVHGIMVTLWRRFISKRHLLQWTTAAHESAHHQDRKSRSAIWRSMWVAPVVSLALGLAIWMINPASLPAASILLALWLAAPEIARALDRPQHKLVKPLDAHDRLFLRSLARRTWLYFETFAGPEDQWLPPDNYQGEPHPEIAHRTSPTNIGMMLLSTSSAWDLGYLGREELAARTANIFASLDRLETHRGHFYNWYETQNLTPLEPRYVSVVDSGNLAGCLVVYRAMLEEMLGGAPVEIQRWSGLVDALRLFAETVEDIGRPLADLGESLSDLQYDIEKLAKRPSGWITGISKIWQHDIPQIEDRISDVATTADTISTVNLRELHIWLERFRHQLQTLQHDIEKFTPWLLIGDIPDSCTEVHWTIVRHLNDGVTSEAVEHGLSELADIICNEQAEQFWCRSFVHAIEEGQRNHAQLIAQLELQIRETAKYVNQMEFAPFYDRDRRLFHIGYNASADRLDTHHYDLLASEARLASFIAIAHRHVPLEHWFHLGRPVMRSDHGLSLISWNGSMFEYLMPRLMMRSGAQTLLSESEKVAVKSQQSYGIEKDLPWGISESAYSSRDQEHRFQYQAFGVPGLGLRRGLAKDMVVAPYASALALQVLPSESAANLKVLSKMGFCGLYGMYDAIDYTPERLMSGKEPAPVNAFMAHHQGMILCAIGNSLCDDILVRRFERDARVRAVSLLLNERVPQELPSEVERLESVDLAGRLDGAAPAITPWQPALTTHSPQCLLLGNGSMSSSISTSGGGGLRWRQQALTRFMPDPVQDGDGLWIFLHDEQSGDLWSTTRQPTENNPDFYDVQFHAHGAEYFCRSHGISARMEVAIAAGDDLEIRRLSLTNLEDRHRSLRVTSYGEAVLAPPMDDERHPAFSKLFIHSEYITDLGAQLLTRRPRGRRDAPPVLLHFLVSDDGALTMLGHESDRRQFLGRNGSLRSPPGAMSGLSGATGYTLDPIISLQVQCDLDPFEQKQFCFVTVAAASREAALEIVERYATMPSLDWAMNDAASAAAHQMTQLGISASQLPVTQQLGALLLYPNSKAGAHPDKIKQNKGGQPSLWGLALSGDHPIFTLKTGSLPDPMLAEVIAAHQLLHARGLKADLVILQSAGSSYIEPVRDDLIALLQELNAQWMLGTNGGVHLLFADQIGADQMKLVEAVSRIMLDSGKGPIAEQLATAFRPSPALPFLERTYVIERSSDLPALGRPENLQFYNGFGGFTEDGREFVIHLEPDQRTPAPWINILANDGFGSLVTESGGGFTWAVNSGENRITPWTNDAVADQPSEILYLRDEETAEVWTPTPEPNGRQVACQIRHGAGYTDWYKISHGLEQNMRIFVPVDDPVKLVKLSLTNHSARNRRVTATYYVNWLLGALSSMSRPQVKCSYDPDLHAIFARSDWNPEFAGRSAFLTASHPPHGMTTDRGEFIGREGDLSFPDALKRWGLGGLADAGTDPCGAYQVHLDLAPGATEELVFILGQGENAAQAMQLVGKWQVVDEVNAAFDRLTGYWDDLLGAVQVETPDRAFDLITNRWLLYQSMSSRIMARAGFYQASGAIGYRDQLQDMMAFLHIDPDRVRAHILDCAAHQFEEGDVLHWWHPPGGRGVRTRCSDDLLWLPYVTCHYVHVTGDEEILQELIPYLRASELSPDEEDRYASFEQTDSSWTLLDHCNRALERGFTRGAHGIPLIGAGDWNDGMDRVGHQGRGESVWLAWFVAVTARAFANLHRRLGNEEVADNWTFQADGLMERAEQAGWDGAWYRRAYDDDGYPWGSASNQECSIDSISQSWALFAGAETARVMAALKSAEEKLVKNDDHITKLLWPPFDKTPRDPGYIKAYPPGIRENGGQYSHAAAWLGIAYARNGNGDLAMEIFNRLSPIHRVQNPVQAEQYRVEPYAVAADIAGGEEHGGRGGWTWYTGAAAWTWRLGVEEILGLKLEDGKLLIEPSLPDHWSGYSAVYRQPGGALKLVVERSDKAADQPAGLIVDGKPIDGNVVAFPTDGTTSEVLVRM